MFGTRWEWGCKQIGALEHRTGSADNVTPNHNAVLDTLAGKAEFGRGGARIICEPKSASQVKIDKFSESSASKLTIIIQSAS